MKIESLSLVIFFSSRIRHTRFGCDWSSDVCSSDLRGRVGPGHRLGRGGNSRAPQGGARRGEGRCRAGRVPLSLRNSHGQGRPGGPARPGRPGEARRVSREPHVTAIDDLQWDSQGLIPALAQEAETGELLMLAWMDRQGGPPPPPARGGDLRRLRPGRAAAPGAPGGCGVPHGEPDVLFQHGPRWIARSPVVPGPGDPRPRRARDPVPEGGAAAGVVRRKPVPERGGADLPEDRGGSARGDQGGNEGRGGCPPRGRGGRPLVPHHGPPGWARDLPPPGVRGARAAPREEDGRARGERALTPSRRLRASLVAGGILLLLGGAAILFAW